VPSPSAEALALLQTALERALRAKIARPKRSAAVEVLRRNGLVLR
jgi:hypothetical protein